jgi:hypothetical protein
LLDKSIFILGCLALNRLLSFELQIYIQLLVVIASKIGLLVVFEAEKVFRPMEEVNQSPSNNQGENISSTLSNMSLNRLSVDRSIVARELFGVTEYFRVL